MSDAGMAYAEVARGGLRVLVDLQRDDAIEAQLEDVGTPSRRVTLVTKKIVNLLRPPLSRDSAISAKLHHFLVDSYLDWEGSRPGSQTPFPKSGIGNEVTYEIWFSLWTIFPE